MKRDGSNTSLWQNDVPDFIASVNQLPGGQPDVIVVGGGITGITTALLLQQAGKKCVLLEAHTLGFGTTSGTTAHLNTLLDVPYTDIISGFGEENARLVANITSRAIDLIETHVNKYQIDCGFKRMSAYLFAQNEEENRLLKKIADATSRAGLSVQPSNTIDIPVPFTKAVSVGTQGGFHPTAYIMALANAFEEAGGVIVQHCKVTDVVQKDVLQVQTCLGEIKCSQLVYATHIPPGINLLHLRCAPYRSYAIAVTLKDGNYPASLVYDLEEPFHYYRTQEVDGQQYLIIGGEDHKTGHEPNTDFRFMVLEAYARQYFDIEKVAFQWSSQYFASADGLPYIGHLPGASENIYVATGFTGNGMTYGTASAIILRDLLTGQTNDFTKLFNPGRIKPVAGFVDFVKENADVAAQLLGKLFSTEKLHELSDLSNGEGKVVKYDGTSVALYKDENGQLHAVHPACTHMKCSVAWNTTEKSWDCPCHGARYSCDGAVLTGPATEGLKAAKMVSRADNTVS